MSNTLSTIIGVILMIAPILFALIPEIKHLNKIKNDK